MSIDITTISVAARGFVNSKIKRGHSLVRFFV